MARSNTWVDNAPVDFSLTEAAFTRQHYQAIADILKKIDNDHQEDEVSEALKEVAQRLAIMFKNDNPAFDKQRFLSACGF